MNFIDGMSTSQHGGIDETDNKYTKVYIGGLLDGVGNDKLQHEFEKFGPIAKIWVARGPHSKGYAFIDYTDPKHAARAIKEMNGKECFGGRILVQISRPSSKKKRSCTNDQSSAVAKYANVKFDYESDLLHHCERPRDRSPHRRSTFNEIENNHRSEVRYEEDNFCDFPNRRNSSGNQASSTLLNYSRDYDSPRRYNIPRDRDSTNGRHYVSRSRSRFDDRLTYISENKNEQLRSSNVPQDEETISRIRDDIIRETVPQLHSIFLTCLRQMHCPSEWQNIHNTPNLNLPENLHTNRNFQSSAGTQTYSPGTQLIFSSLPTSFAPSNFSSFSSNAYCNKTTDLSAQNSTGNYAYAFAPCNRIPILPCYNSIGNSSNIPTVLNRNAPPVSQGSCLPVIQNYCQQLGSIGNSGTFVHYPNPGNATSISQSNNVISSTISSTPHLKSQDSNRHQ